MESVGIRELRQRASALLRLVEAGETVEITDRGRPVALLTPTPDSGPLERLRQGGQVQAPRADLEDLPAPLVLDPGQLGPSGILAELRRDER